MASKECLAIESGLYTADRSGRIFSSWSGKIKEIRPTRTPSGYLKFNAYFGEKIFSIYFHRFIWSYFYGEIPSKLQINHLDFKRHNNLLSNLELSTAKQNMRHSAAAGRLIGSAKHLAGENNPKAKLNEEQVRTIYKLSWSKKTKVSEIAEMFGVGTTAIYCIKYKKMWKHLWV